MIGGVEFEDDRIKSEDWKEEVKPKTPFGQLPVLYVDGKVAAQSNAILRYVGKLGGLYPESPEQALEVDEVLDTLYDITQAMFGGRGLSPEAFRASREKFVSEDVPRLAGGLEKRLAVFGEGPWAVGSKVSIADLQITVIVITLLSGILDHIPTDVFSPYSRIMSSYESVMEIPKVVEWYKKYPVKALSM